MFESVGIPRLAISDADGSRAGRRGGHMTVGDSGDGSAGSSGGAGATGRAGTAAKVTPAAGGKRRRTKAEAATADTAATVRDFPDGPPDETGLTPRQRRVLEVIRAAVERRGYPPSVREIGESVGLTSTSSVAHQMKVLEAKGFLRRDPHRPRAVEVLLPSSSAVEAGAGV